LGRRQAGVVDQVFDGVVAIGAIEPGVNGLAEGIGVKYRERHGFARHGARSGGITVARQAIVVGNGVGGKAAR
jgi:hypothetical protein